MGRSAFGLVFGFALLLLLFAFSVQGLFILERVALIDQLEGEAQVKRAGTGQVVEARLGLPVKTGDEIVTSTNSRLRLHWADGTTMRIGPNSKVVIKKSRFNTASKKSESLFSLHVGSVFASLRRKLSEGSFFTISTPSVVAGVRGTQFAVLSQGKGPCTVSVWEGKVRVRSGRVRLTLNSREVAEVARKGEVRKRPLLPQEEARWREELEHLLAPHLRLLRPKDGEVVLEPVVEVRGVTDSFAKLTVNRKPVKVSPLGRFRTQVKLRPGANSIEVVADDGRGHVTTKRLIVFFGRPVPQHPSVSLEIPLSSLPADGFSSVVVRAKVEVNGKPAPDGTPVKFTASAGRITPHATTKNGVATAVYTSSSRPGEVVIRAYCGKASAEAKLTLTPLPVPVR